MGVSVIIPSKQEKFLNQTILDVLAKAQGDIQVIPVLDGYDTDRIDDPRVTYQWLDASKANQKRHAVNQAVSIAEYEHIMVLDAHCLMGEGFDTVLSNYCHEHEVVIPRRDRLDPENWCVHHDGRPVVDYEYPMFQDFKKGRLHSYKWNQRTLDRIHIPIDETMGFQGSCYFMHKAYFKHLGLMQIEGYGGFAQESEEIVRKVRLDGGKVRTNKLTFYAHLHKGKRYGRMYDLNWDEVGKSITYSYNKFVKENSKVFEQMIEQFWPIPNWPHNWKDYIYG